MCREVFGQDQPIIISPLMKIEMLPMTGPLDPYCGLIFTSENGVLAFAQASDQRHLPAYCVGNRTADAARAVGLTAYSANGSADDLVAMIRNVPAKGRYLHVRGEHTRGDIAGRLGLAVDEVVAYRQTSVSLSDEARVALAGDQPVILPLFSPRTAQLFCQDADQIKAPLRIVVISDAVGKVVSNLDSAEITVATTPDAAAMLRAIQGRIDA